MSQQLHFLFFLTDLITYSDFADLLDFYKLHWLLLSFGLYSCVGFPFGPWEWDYLFCLAPSAALISMAATAPGDPLTDFSSKKKLSHVVPLYFHQLWLSTLLVQ